MKKIIAAGLLLTCASAYADTTTVAGKISTLGLGMDVAIPVSESVDARLGFNTYNYNFNKATSSAGLTTNYSGKLNLQSFMAVADYHPFDSGFRLSGGALYNGNKFTMTAVPTGGAINLGGVACAGCSATANVDFNSLAPYLGIGWGSAPKDTGFSVSADLGVMFQGSPRTTVTATGATAAQIAQANADLNASLNNFRYYPVLSIGIGYSF